MKKGLDHILLFVVFCVRVDGFDVTLTTAVVRDATTPRPTAIHRRIHVDQRMGGRINAPMDLLGMKAAEFRRASTDIWNWDYWCQLQPKIGNCTKSMIRYYYDAQIDQCKPFTYTGCNKNNNNFNSPNDCERYCKGTAYMSIKESSNPIFCELQPNAGLCLALFNMYYYDVNNGTCKSFIYGGCGGNQNRFSSKKECMSRCRPDDD